jgi:hypothetical protein
LKPTTTTTTPQTTVYFGNNKTATGFDEGDQGYSFRNVNAVFKITGTGTYNVRGLEAYFREGTARLAIYDSNGNFIMQGNSTVSSSGSAAWYGHTQFVNQDKTLIANPKLQGETNYILVVSFDSSSYAALGYTSGSSGDSCYLSGNYSNGYPLIIGNGTSQANVYCIRCQVEFASAETTTTSSVAPTSSTTTSSVLPTTSSSTTSMEPTTTTTVQPTTSTSIYSGGGGGGGGGGGSVVDTNTTPIADAGAAQSAFDGDLITLDGSGSYDNDGDTLSYQWAQVSGPTVALSNAAAAQPEFYAPAVGTFTFSLVVSDGQASSALDTVTITVKEADNMPVAMAGNDLTVQIGDKVVLDGTASYDSDGDTLSYKWIQVSGPAVNLSNPDSATPYFIAAIEGNYQFNLTVFDGILWSLIDSVVITIKQPTINLISPGIDVKMSGSVKLTWSGTGFVKFKVLVSKDGKSFTSLGETTNQDYTLSSLTTLMLSGRKGSPVYWKIQGQRSVQTEYWVTSELRKFYAARTLRIYQNAIRELLAIIFNKQYESPSYSQTVINKKELLPQYMVRSLIESP